MIPEVKFRRKKAMTNILGFDTSTNMCSVALQCGAEVDVISELAPRRHTQLILGMIDKLLKRNNITLKNLDAVAFGSGPGSFMGVRLAASVAQALAYANDLPIVPVSTLQLLAQQGHKISGSSQIVSAWDARMTEMYFGCYKLAENQLMHVHEVDSLIKPEHFVLPEGEWLLVGNAWKVYEDVLSLPCKKLTELYPDASCLVAIAETLYDEGKTTLALQAAPNYVRDKVADVPKDRS